MPELQDRELAAFHEAGHLFVLRHFGYKVEWLEVNGDSGATVLPNQPMFSNHLLAALVGGEAAEAKWRGGWGNAEAWHKSGEHKRAFGLALRASNNDRRAACLLMSWAERVASTIVEKNWTKLGEVANTLAEQGKLRVGNMEVTRL